MSGYPPPPSPNGRGGYTFMMEDPSVMEDPSGDSSMDQRYPPLEDSVSPNTASTHVLRDLNIDIRTAERRRIGSNPPSVHASYAESHMTATSFLSPQAYTSYYNAPGAPGRGVEPITPVPASAFNSYGSSFGGARQQNAGNMLGDGGHNYGDSHNDGDSHGDSYSHDHCDSHDHGYNSNDYNHSNDHLNPNPKSSHQPFHQPSHQHSHQHSDQHQHFRPRLIDHHLIDPCLRDPRPRGPRLIDHQSQQIQSISHPVSAVPSSHTTSPEVNVNISYGSSNQQPNYIQYPGISIMTMDTSPHGGSGNPPGISVDPNVDTLDLPQAGQSQSGHGQQTPAVIRSHGGGHPSDSGDDSDHDSDNEDDRADGFDQAVGGPGRQGTSGDYHGSDAATVSPIASPSDALVDAGDDVGNDESNDPVDDDTIDEAIDTPVTPVALPAAPPAAPPAAAAAPALLIATEENLSAVVVRHKSDKKWTCEFCGREGVRKRHIGTHVTYCRFPGCSLTALNTFRDGCDTAKHIRLVHGTGRLNWTPQDRCPFPGCTSSGTRSRADVSREHTLAHCY
ncbi:hypothetical protein F4677DRAFT_458486 [Hypoxylon crocopeplum]|nr:hypothetical protein F4677DRAFT_458486 [Hypoxylon crocopeplum]